MSDEFKNFGEAARLYAKYVPVVDEMERIFTDEVSRFLSTMRTRMQANLQTGEIGVEQSEKYLYWWIEDDETKQNDDPPYLLIERRSAEIITPGILTVNAVIDVWDTIRTSLALPAHCKAAGRKSICISYGDNDPIEATADPVLKILRALHEAEKAYLKSGV